MHGAVASLVGGVLPSNTFRELQLPVKLPDKERLTFGLGLTSAVDVAPAAYLTSLSFRHLLQARMRDEEAKLALSDYWYANQAHALLKLRCKTDALPLLDVLEDSMKKVSQKELMFLIKERSFHDLNKGDERTRTFRATFSLPGAKDWVHAAPSPALLTHVPNRPFRSWLRFYCRMPSPHEHQTHCPRPGCKAENDVYGDHLIICPHSSLVGWASVSCRHDRIVRLVAENLREARRRPVIEPKQREDEHTRVDIRAIGLGGGDDIIDVSMCHATSSKSAITSTIASPPSLLLSSYNKKVKKHKPLLKSQTAGSVVPLIGMATGGWEHRSYRYLREISLEIGASSDINPAWITATLFRRLAARLVANIGDALTIDP